MATDPRAPLITRIPPKPTHFAYRTGTRASDIPLLTAGTTTGVTINEQAPTTRRIIQTDDGQVYATVSFSGGYSGGTPASMQVRLNYKGGGAFQANTTLSGFSAGGGAWSGTMPVPAGSWLLAIAQDPTSGQTSSAQTIWWGVGDRFDLQQGGRPFLELRRGEFRFFLHFPPDNPAGQVIAFARRPVLRAIREQRNNNLQVSKIGQK